MAVFVSLAEVSGSAVLPTLTGGVQEIFLWFVMLFPVLIVILFFATLNWNHKVLYAPTDFRDDKSFLDLIRPMNEAERIQKLTEMSSEKELDEHVTTASEIPIIKTTADPKVTYSFQAKAREAEALVIQDIQKEFPLPFTREVSFEDVGYFDAMAPDTKRKEIIAVEVKYLKSGYFDAKVIHKLIHQSEALRKSASEHGYTSRLILAVVIGDEAKENHKKAIKKQIEEITKYADESLDVRIFDFSELKNNTNQSTHSITASGGSE